MTLNSTPVGGAVGTGPTLGGEREWAAGGVAMATVGGHGAAAVRCHRGTGSGWGGVPRAPRDTDVPSGHRGTLLPHGAEGVQPSSGAADSARVPVRGSAPMGGGVPTGCGVPVGCGSVPIGSSAPVGGSAPRAVWWQPPHDQPRPHKWWCPHQEQRPPGRQCPPGRHRPRGHQCPHTWQSPPVSPNHSHSLCWEQGFIAAGGGGALHPPAQAVRPGSPRCPHRGVGDRWGPRAGRSVDAAPRAQPPGAGLGWGGAVHPQKQKPEISSTTKNNNYVTQRALSIPEKQRSRRQREARRGEGSQRRVALVTGMERRIRAAPMPGVGAGGPTPGLGSSPPHTAAQPLFAGVKTARRRGRC